MDIECLGVLEEREDFSLCRINDTEGMQSAGQWMKEEVKRVASD